MTGVQVLTGGIVGWDIDAAAFYGAPRVTARDDGDSASIIVRGARFPGTALSADLDARIERVHGNWQLAVTFARAAAAVQADLLPWLARTSLATGFARTGAGLTFVTAARGGVSLERDAHVTFAADWVLRFEAPDGVVLRIDRERHYGHALEITPTAELTSLLGAAETKRTWLSVFRHEADWPVVPALAGSGWSLATSASAISAARIECVEDSEGVDAVAQFCATDGTAALQLGQAAESLPLRNIRYSVPLNATRHRSFFVADFPETPTWLSLGRTSICLGHCEGAQPLQILVEDREARAFRGAPGVFGVSLAQSNDGPQLAPLKTLGEPLRLIPEHKVGFWKRLACWLHLSNCDELCVPLRQGSTELVRPDDQLRLRLELRGVDLETKDGCGVITPSKGAPGDARLIVHFPPQHLLEEVFYEQAKFCDGTLAPDVQHGNCKPKPPRDLYPPPVASLISGPSRLVFDIDKSIHYTAAALLNWSPLAVRVSRRATRPGQRPAAAHRLPAPLADDETQVEIPTRVMLSPNDLAIWVGSGTRRAKNDRRYELWHARLGTKRIDANGGLTGVSMGGALRAMWTPGYDPKCLPGHDSLPFASTLNHRDRVEFVALTSNFDLNAKGICPGDTVPESQKYLPEPIGAEHLMLSSMGGWLKSRGTWDPPMTETGQALTVEQWEHRAVMARDQFVKVVYRGFLVPLGVRCVLVKTSERKIQDISGYGRNPVAVIRQRYEIIVREAEKTYPALAQPFDARGWGFRAVHFQDGFTTPVLDWPGDQSIFWPYVGCEPFLFPFELETLDGERLPCRAPLLFIDNTVAYGECAGVLASPESNPCAEGGAADLCPPTTANPIKFRDSYNNAPEAMRTWQLHDGKVTYAASKTPGETRFETKQILVRADEPDWETKTDIAGCSFHPGGSEEAKKARLCLTLFKENRAPVFPFVKRAEVRIAAVEQLTGKFEYFKIEPDPTYVLHGFVADVNVGEVFARIIEPRPLQFTGGGAAHGDKSGAIASPNTTLVGLSRKLGPIGGSPQNVAQSLAAVSTGEFRPADYFGSQIESAKLLGGIRLVDILAAIAPLGEAPEALRRVIGLELEVFRTAVTLLLDGVRDLLLPVKFFERRVQGDYDAARQLLSEMPASPSGGGSTGVGDVIAILAKQAAIVERLRHIGSAVDEAVRHPQSVAEDELTPWLTQHLTPKLDRLKAEAQAIHDLVLPNPHPLIVAARELEALVKATAGNEAAKFLTVAITRIESAAAAVVSSEDASAVLETASRMLSAADDLRVQARRLTDAIAVAQAQKALIQDGVRAFVRTEAEAAATRAVNVVFQTARGELEPLVDQAIAALPVARQAEARRAYAAVVVVHRRIEELAGRLRSTTPATLLSALQEVFRAQADLVAALTQLHEALQPLAVGLRTPVLDRAEMWLQQFTSYTGISAGTVTTLKNLLLTGATVGDNLTRLKLRADTLGDRLTQATAGVPADWANAGKVKAGLEIGADYIMLFADALAALGLPVQDLNTAAQTLTAFAASVEQGWNKVVALETELRAAIDQAPLILRAQATRLLEEAFAPLRTKLTEAERKVQERTYALVGDVLSNLRRMKKDLLSLLRPTLTDIAQVLEIKERFERELANLLKPVDIELSYRWSPTIHDFGGIFETRRPEGGFSLVSTVRIPISPATATVGTPTMSLRGELIDFTLHLLHKETAYFIAVDFEHAIFSSRTGSAPTCDVKIREIHFKGCLEFIEDLRNWLKGKDGVFLDLRADQVITGFRFTLPVIPLAAMLLQNVRLEAAFLLRFNGDPFRILLGVSSKRSPAELVAGPYGGTLYVQMVLGPDGIESFAMGMAFGLVGRIEIGPISGSGRLVAGIAIDRTKAGVELSGFVETAGQVSLIGLSICVYGYLGLHYAANGACRGEVLIEITIELFMFEVSFSFHVVKEFSGGPGQTTPAPLTDRAETDPLPLLAAAAAASGVDVLEIDWKHFNEAFEEAYGA